MRLVKINARGGLGQKVIGTAFDVGIERVSVNTVEVYSRGGRHESAEVVDLETSTPASKRFVEALLAADYYDPAKISFNTRQPRAIASDQSDREMTRPLVEPSTELYQELWQFTHVTYGLIGRVFVSGCLLAYGLIEARMLLIIAGLLFLPLLPMVMAISYGFAGRRPGLALQGGLALVAAAAVLVVGGAAVAALCRPPMRSDDLVSPLISVLICAAVGVAAALASEDDAGRRELIGLAAAAQIGMIPVMLGIGLVFGTPTSGQGLMVRSGTFIANVATIAVAVILTQYLTGVVGNIRRLKRD
ncbi:MAG TPA: hypothetical protein VGO43_12165 [Pyrinomonadaceae bacterium]|nr:hypothetical protein [Pyrinomonadaceae bacterium]